RDASTDAIRFIENVPDSLVFTTSSGRLVYAGGGIVPDHIIQGDTTGSYVLGFMRRKRTSTERVMDFLGKEGESFRNDWKGRFEEFRTDFSWDEQHMAAFRARVTSAGLM